MKKEDWGIKRICCSCGVRFYDFNKSSIVCPACGALFDCEYIIKRKVKNIDKVDEVEETIDLDAIDTADMEEDALELDSDEEVVVENEK